jgi:glucarate dehydratase
MVVKIRSVRATPVNIPFKAPYRFAYGSTASLTKTIVEVETDEGIVGLGEGADGDTSVLIEQLGERLVGLDPLGLNTCERRCLPSMSYAPWDNLTALRRAFGAIEIALWDIRGRAEDRPLHDLLGGAVRTEIPLTEYFAFRLRGASEGGESNATDIARYCARMIEDYAADGFEGKIGTIDIREEVKMVGEVRAAIGPDRMLRVDANGGFTIATALEVWRHIEPYGIRTFEDPVDSLEEMAKLRPHMACTFSTHNPDLRRAVALGVPDHFVCNIVELGGIRRTVEFVRSCEAFGIGFWFHSQEAGVASAAYLQLSAALEPIREPSQTLFRWLADDVVTSGPREPRGGRVTVPEGPGLGVDLDRDALNRCHARYVDEGPFPAGTGGGHYGSAFQRV